MTAQATGALKRLPGFVEIARAVLTFEVNDAEVGAGLWVFELAGSTPSRYGLVVSFGVGACVDDSVTPLKTSDPIAIFAGVRKVNQRFFLILGRLRRVTEVKPQLSASQAPPISTR